MTIQLVSLFTGEVDVRPKKAALFTTDNYDTIIQPNYLYSAINAANPLCQGDFVFASYDGGSSNGIFTIDVSNGDVYTLNPHITSDFLPNGHIYVGNEDNEATPVTMSNDATISNTGAVTIANNAITTVKIADANITTTKIADSNVTSDKIANSNIITDKIADFNVTAGKLANSSVTTDKIVDANVTTNKILDSNVTTSKIANGNVTLAKLAPGITPSHIVVYAGIYHYGGGSENFSISLPGLLDTDIASFNVANTSFTSLLKFVITNTDQLDIEMSPDPGPSVFYYTIVRAAS